MQYSNDARANNPSEFFNFEIAITFYGTIVYVKSWTTSYLRLNILAHVQNLEKKNIYDCSVNIFLNALSPVTFMGKFFAIYCRIL